MKNLLVVVFVVFLASEVDAQKMRKWADCTGNVEIAGDLIARDDDSIVLQTRDKKLYIVEIDDLCDADKEYLDSEAAAATDKHSFQLRNGMKIEGTVVGYGKREVTYRARSNKVVVNDRSFQNLPEVYQKLAMAIANEFGKQNLKTEKELSDWLRKQSKRKTTFEVEGVMLEMANGDQYGFPFFVFNASERTGLENGYRKWEQAEADAKYQKHVDLELRARARQEERRKQEQLDLQRLSVQLQAYDSGLLWEVELIPPRGYSVRVIVPGRNSDQAANNALQKYPGYRVGAIAKMRSDNGRWRW